MSVSIVRPSDSPARCQFYPFTGGQCTRDSATKITWIERDNRGTRTATMSQNTCLTHAQELRASLESDSWVLSIEVRHLLIVGYAR